jgi:hypothetical protein
VLAPKNIAYQQEFLSFPPATGIISIKCFAIMWEMRKFASDYLNKEYIT